eukprot:s176_g24.t3
MPEPLAKTGSRTKHFGLQEAKVGAFAQRFSKRRWLLHMQADVDENERRPNHPRSKASQEEVLEPPAFGIATQAVYAGVIGSFLYGYMLCYLNSCMDFITLTFEWCKSSLVSDCLESRINSGLVNALLYLGAAAGALLLGRPFMSYQSSRQQLMISDLFFIAGGFFGAFATGIKCLLMSRMLSGIALGISAIAAPVYIAEVSPAEQRGLHAAKHGLYIAVGLLCAELIGLPQDPPGNGLTETNRWFWRVILGLPILAGGFQYVLMKFDLPIDPALYLVRQGQMEEARMMLYRTYGLSAPESSAGLEQVRVTKLELKLKDLAVVAAEAQAAKRITVVQALQDRYLRCSIMVGFFLASYQQLTGINALMAYSNGLFAQAGIPDNDLTLASVGMCIANVLVSVWSTQLVDNMGRRSLLLYGCITQSLAMASMVYVVQFLPLVVQGISAFVFFSFFVVSWNFGLGAITWLWLSEIYPSEIRGPALSACGVIKWLSCFFVVLIARFLNLHSSCLLFGGFSLGSGWMHLRRTPTSLDTRRLGQSFLAQPVQETEEERQRLDQEAREGMQEYMKLIQDIWAVCHHDSAHGKKRQCTSAVFAQELAEGGNIRWRAGPGRGQGGQEFIDAKIVKVNPDTPQKSVRVAALRSRKILYVPQPRLRTGFFSRIEPGTVPPDKYNFAATARGMKQLADPMDLDDKTKIDVVVVGSSAVHPESGIRVGKGEGFAELEYGIMRQLGMIDDLGPGLDMFHSKGMMKHDVPVDIIVTPTQTIYVDKAKQPSKPKGIYWDLLSREKLATIRVLQDLKARIESQTGIQLELAEQEEALPPLAKRGSPRKDKAKPRKKEPQTKEKEKTAEKYHAQHDVFVLTSCRCNSVKFLLRSVSALGVVGIYFWVLETKGCDMEDSPMTPRSERSSSSLLGGGTSPASPVQEHLMGVAEREEEEEDEEETAVPRVYQQVD